MLVISWMRLPKSPTTNTLALVVHLMTMATTWRMMTIVLSLIMTRKSAEVMKLDSQASSLIESAKMMKPL